MVPLDKRFDAVVALLDSDKSGERSAALDAANRMLTAAGLTWRDLVVSVQRQDDARKDHRLSPECQRAFGIGAHWAFCNGAFSRADIVELMTEWEYEFLQSIAERDILTEKQAAAFRRVKERLRRARYGGAQAV